MVCFGGTAAILATLLLSVHSESGMDSKVIEIEPGYCTTWYNDSDYEEIVVVNCPYFIAEPICQNKTLPKVLGPELNDEMCHYFKRTGPSCGSCVDKYGPAAFSTGVACADCSSRYRGLLLLLYIALQLLCVTLLYAVVAIFQLQITHGPLNVLVYFSQVVVNSAAIDPLSFSTVMCTISGGFVKFLFTLYGIWNLDFFRYIIPPICVTPSARNIDVIMFDYIVAIYPLLLTFVLYAAIELHDRDCKVIVCLWRPFKYCLSRWRPTGNTTPRESIIKTFASFILLSYSKFLYTSLSLLYSEKRFKYPNTTQSIGRVLYYDSTIEFFGTHHLPYILVSFLILVFLIFIPPFLLLVYPTRACGWCLQCCRFPRQDILQQLMDTFQGWYKDGTDGTRDYRALSSLYLILRLVVGLASLLTGALHNFHGTSLPWVVIGLLHGAIGMFFLVIKPYKKSYMNNVDGTILVLFASMAILVGQKDPIVQTIAYLLLSVPLLGGLLYLLTKTKIGASKFKIVFLQTLKKLRRRNNTDEQDYPDDISTIDRVLHPTHYHGNMATETAGRIALKSKDYGAAAVSSPENEHENIMKKHTLSSSL